MPYRLQEPRRHHIGKITFKISNWSSYDEGLRNRGSLTFWIEEAVLQSWYAAPRTTPGGQPIYADGTIEMILTLGMVYHLPLRQTEGLARSVLSLPVPRHSTLSRRRPSMTAAPHSPKRSPATGRRRGCGDPDGTMSDVVAAEASVEFKADVIRSAPITD